MRKVGEVLVEIQTTKEHCNILRNIANKMENDRDIRKYMMETFGLDASTMNDIAIAALMHKTKLECKLNESMVDFD